MITEENLFEWSAASTQLRLLLQYCTQQELLNPCSLCSASVRCRNSQLLHLLFVATLEGQFRMLIT